VEDERKVAAELGERVREKRESLGLTLDDINKKTKIRKAFLEAIEEGNLKILSGIIYVKGFIKTYLKAINAEGLYSEYEKLLNSLAAERENKNLEKMVDYMPPQKRFRKPSRWWIYSALLILLVASGFMVWQEREQIRMKSKLVLEQKNSSTAKSVTPVADIASSDDMVVSESVNAEEASLPQEIETEQVEPNVEVVEKKQDRQEDPVKQEKLLTMKFDGSCWIRITKGEKVIFQGTLKKGQKKDVLVDIPVNIRYGNAGAVQNLWNGELKEKIGQKGEVVTYEYLPDGTMRRM